MLILNKTSFWKNFSIIQYVSTHLKLGLICFFNFMKSHLFDHMKQVHQYFFMINKKLTWHLFVNWYVIFIAFSKIFIKYSTGRNFDKKFSVCSGKKKVRTTILRTYTEARMAWGEGSPCFLWMKFRLHWNSPWCFSIFLY